ncbi:MAG: hypothetical protein L0Y56_01965 [Nitrospira sp.]|nr:hypothetical protein [Nitrospira sp.]
MLSRFPDIAPVKTTTLLNAVTIPTISQVQTLAAVRKGFHIIITGTATVAIEASNNGTGFVIISPSVSANALIASNDVYKFYRANASAVTAGTVTVIMSTGGSL